jgi:hypothetical protein
MLVIGCLLFTHCRCSCVQHCNVWGGKQQSCLLIWFSCHACLSLARPNVLHMPSMVSPATLAGGQVVAEYKKAVALIKPGPRTAKVWVSLYGEIEKVGGLHGRAISGAQRTQQQPPAPHVCAQSTLVGANIYSTGKHDRSMSVHSSAQNSPCQTSSMLPRCACCVLHVLLSSAT